MTNHLPDCFNYLSFCHTHYLILWINTSLLQCFNTESSQELISLEEYRSALRKQNSKQRQVVMFLILLFKLSPFVSFSFLSFSILSPLPFSILTLSFPLASLLSLLSLLINSLSYPKMTTSTFIQLVYLVKCH